MDCPFQALDIMGNWPGHTPNGREIQGLKTRAKRAAWRRSLLNVWEKWLELLKPAAIATQVASDDVLASRSRPPADR
jgi:hypothetical protein